MFRSGLKMSSKFTRPRPPSNRTQTTLTTRSNDLILKTITKICLKEPIVALMILTLIAPTHASRPSPKRPPLAYESTHQHHELSRLRPLSTTSTAYQLADLAPAEQLEEPMRLEADGGRYSSLAAAGGLEHDHEQSPSDDSYALEAERQPLSSSDDDNDEAMENSHERTILNNHQSHLRAMRDMFERRQLNQNQAGAGHNNNNNNERMHHALGQSSQELSPISIGLDPGSPFSMPPFALAGEGNVQAPPPMMAPHPKPHMSTGPEQLEPAGGPSLAFGLNPLPHLLGFQSSAFDGPQRGDQSAHHAAASSQSAADPEMGPSQKVWPKIFRFTDGRINLSDFEKQKKIALSSKANRHENHIESAPIMFDGRQLKRKSFLILHGGVFPGNR